MLLTAYFVVTFSTSAVADDEESETVTYIIEEEFPHSEEVTEEVEILERDSSSVAEGDKKSARHYEHYASFIDNPFAGKHEPEPHYTRYKYPYDPHHNPYQYLPDEHYPNVAIKHHPIHRRKRRSPDLFRHDRQLAYKPQRHSPKHSSYPDHDFVPQYNDPSAYGEKPHYPAHDFPLEHNNPSGYGNRPEYPDHHLDLQYNHPSIYKQDPHHKPHHHYKRHLPHQNRQHIDNQYGRISHSGSTHFLFPNSFNKRIRRHNKRNVLDDKHYNIPTKYFAFSNNPFADKHQPEPEYNAYNYGLPGEVLHARSSGKVITNYSNLELTPKYDEQSFYEHLSRSPPNNKHTQ